MALREPIGGLHPGLGSIGCSSELLPVVHLRRDEYVASCAIPSLISNGRLDLVEQIVQLHSPLQRYHDVWINVWCLSVKEACRHGNLPVLRRLVECPIGSEACEDMKNENDLSDLLSCAAELGHAEMMEYLYNHGLADAFEHSVKNAIRKNQMKSLKWLPQHVWEDEGAEPFCAIDKAPKYGRLEMIKLLNSYEPSKVCENTESKRRRISETNRWWSRSRDAVFYAAEGVTWLYSNGSKIIVPGKYVRQTQ